MFSLTQRVREGRTHDSRPTVCVDIDRLDFRNALVIEESSVLRRSIVQMLKKRGWIAHGIKAVGQAIPFPKCIPYHLIVVDDNASTVAAVQFVRTLRSSDQWSKIPMVIITDSLSESLPSHPLKIGVSSARRSAWMSDLSNILADLERHGHWKK